MHDTDTAPAVESTILKQIKRFGGQTPDRITNRPRLAAGLQFYFSAFYDLDTERSLINMDPIPWSRTMNYGKYHDLNEEEMDDLLYLIREVDNAYLRRIGEKRR